MTFRNTRRIILGKSLICDGFGMFAGVPFKEHEYIGEYKGETLYEDEENLRAVIFTATNRNYIFTLITDKSENWQNSVDAIDFGNKTRFLNHGIEWLENCIVRNMMVSGNRRIGFFAKKDIPVGDELLFDYSTNYNLPWLKEFNNQIRAQKHAMNNKNRKKVDLFSDVASAAFDNDAHRIKPKPNRKPE